MTTGITPLEAERIAERAAEDVLQKLGLDISNVHEMQADMIYVRRQRQASEQVSTWTRRIILTAFITGVISVLGVGITQGIKGLLP